jgi:hypothetical protein
VLMQTNGKVIPLEIGEHLKWATKQKSIVQ